jgi:hypothetical protein
MRLMVAGWRVALLRSCQSGPVGGVQMHLIRLTLQ